MKRQDDGLYFEDIVVGQTFRTSSKTVTHAAIVAFATEFDRNPFHLADEAAQAVGLPGVIASGFHTLSLSFALFFELHLWDAAILPSPGLDRVRWLPALLPDQSIHVRATVVECVPSRSRPDQGVVRLVHETIEESSGQAILSVEALHRLLRRSEQSMAIEAGADA